MSSTVKKKVLIAGASGLVGQAALRECEHDLDWDGVGVSRRAPARQGRGRHVSLDLLDKDRCAEVFSQLSDDTHLKYGAVTEDPTDLVAGSRDRARPADREGRHGAARARRARRARPARRAGGAARGRQATTAGARRRAPLYRRAHKEL